MGVGSSYPVSLHCAEKGGAEPEIVESHAAHSQTSRPAQPERRYASRTDRFDRSRPGGRACAPAQPGTAPVLRIIGLFSWHGPRTPRAHAELAPCDRARPGRRRVPSASRPRRRRRHVRLRRQDASTTPRAASPRYVWRNAGGARVRGPLRGGVRGARSVRRRSRRVHRQLLRRLRVSGGVARPRRRHLQRSEPGHGVCVGLRVRSGLGRMVEPRDRVPRDAAAASASAASASSPCMRGEGLLRLQRRLRAADRPHDRLRVRLRGSLQLLRRSLQLRVRWGALPRLRPGRAVPGGGDQLPLLPGGARRWVPLVRR